MINVVIPAYLAAFYVFDLGYDRWGKTNVIKLPHVFISIYKGSISRVVFKVVEKLLRVQDRRWGLVNHRVGVLG